MNYIMLFPTRGPHLILLDFTDPGFCSSSSFPNLGIQHVTKKNVGYVLMDRYLKMQMLHTATLNALTTDPRVFDIGAMVDEATADGDRGEFDKQIADTIAGINFVVFPKFWTSFALILSEHAPNGNESSCLEISRAYPSFDNRNSLFYRAMLIILISLKMMA